MPPLKPKFLRTPNAAVDAIRTVIHCAVELQEAGVRFIRSKNRGIRFNPKTGKFHLPPLVVNHELLNVITFEHLHGVKDPYVTNYVCLLSQIIDSANDVSLLQRKGIILNKLASNEEVAMLFNRIAKESTIVDPNFTSLRVRTDVFEYCQKKRHQWKTNLINTYFKSPWSAISLAGALLAIILTFIQTLYTIRGK